jgi:hypothetical protein
VLDGLTEKVNAVNESLAGQVLAADAASSALNDVTKAAAAAAIAQNAAADAADRNSRAVAGGAYGYGLLAGAVNAAARVSLPLFGGALSKIPLIAAVGGVHLLIEGIAETAAVVIPASIALAAFGFAAAGTVSDITSHMSNMNTVVTATGRAIYPLTGAFQAVQNAVQPQVYQLFGEALNVVNSKTGELTKLASGAGSVLDQLAARAEVAFTSGGMSTFLQHADSDLMGIGTFFGNLFGIIGNFLKTMPGYAERLLGILDGVSHVVETITASAPVQDITKVGLAAHGALLYVGLAATAASFGVSKALLGIGNLAANLGSTEGKLAGFGTVGEKAAGALRVFGVEAAGASQLPWGWIAVAAAGIGFLVYELVSAKDATQQWLGSLQNGITSAKTITQGVTDLGNAQAQVASQLGGAKDQLGAVQHKYIDVTEAAGKYGSMLVRELNPAYADATQKVNDLTSGQRQLTDEQKLAGYRIDLVGSAYTHASSQQEIYKTGMGLLVAAGVPMSQLLTKNSEQLAEIKAEVAATANAYHAMGQSGGQLGNDLQVLDRQTADTYTTMQNLNSAWDTFIGNATKTQTAFDSYAQGLTSVDTAAAKHNATMDGLNKNALALNQTFSSQIGTTTALFDTWRQAGVQNDLFTKGVKAAIDPMVRYAKGSQEATDQLVALAEEAGYNGPASLQSLTQWLGKAGNATLTVKQVSDQATQQEALLTSAMQQQGDYIANKLIGDINNAILSYNGVQKAAVNYGNAVAQDGRQSQAAHAARTTLIDDLIASGKAAHDSTRQIAALITKVTGIPIKRSLEIVMKGDGSYSINGNTAYHKGSTSGHQIGPGGGVPGGHAAGGLIRGPGGPTSDSIPIWASNREYMVKAAAVQKYGTHAMDAVNTGRAVIGYADGGLIDQGNKAVLSGQYAVSTYQAYEQAFQNAMVAAMRRSLQSAQQAAMSFLGGGPQTGPLQDYARKLLAAYGWGGQWPQFNAVVNAESGWNVHATNPSSGAYGIPQALPPSKMASAGPDWMTSGYTQLRWMMAYIAQRWHDPAGAWANESRYHWYRDGLAGGIFTRPTLIGVGDGGPERVDVTPLGGDGAAAPVFNVRVYVGDREITDIVRTEIDCHDKKLAGKLRVGTGALR